MPVPPTEDNPHGWGYIEKRKVVEYYQLSPRVQIVVGDIIKVSKGAYWINKDDVKVSMDTMKGKWMVNGIFEGKDGLEMDIVHCWPGGLFGSTTTIRVTGDEYPSPIVDIITRRPFKVKLANPRSRRKSSQKQTYKSQDKPKSVKSPEQDESKWSNLADIIRRKTKK